MDSGLLNVKPASRIVDLLVKILNTFSSNTFAVSKSAVSRVLKMFYAELLCFSLLQIASKSGSSARTVKFWKNSLILSRIRMLLDNAEFVFFEDRNSK